MSESPVLDDYRAKADFTILGLWRRPGLPC